MGKTAGAQDKTAGTQEKAFARAVWDAEAAPPGTLKRQAGQAPLRRFNVYRNNVYASLIDLLAGRFPVTAKLVGEEFFRAMALAFVQEQPPRSPVLLGYGETFAGFIAAFPPANPVPYLSDVARLEWAWHHAYHAADATPLPVSALSAVANGAAGGGVEQARMGLHPALSVVRSTYPVVTIWQLGARESEDESQRLPAHGEDACIVRPLLEVEVRRLRLGGAAFIAALQAGSCLEAAAAAAKTDSPNFDLEANLAGLMSSGAIVAIN